MSQMTAMCGLICSDCDAYIATQNDDDEKRVDMGADEYCNETSDNDADFNDDGNGDGVVNYVDFAIFSKAWLSENDPCDDNWNPVCNISEITDNVIDANDLIVFAEEWLWMSCEGMKGIPMMEMMMGAGMGRMAGGESMLISAPATEQISKTPSEPSIEKQIEQIKQSIDFLYEVKDQVEDKEACLGMVTSLEEMLKGLEDSQ